MRSVSTLILLAAANQAFAGTLRHRDNRHHERALRVDNVVITQEIVVTQYADGALKTAEPEAIGTATIIGTPIVETSITPVSTIQDTPAPLPTTTSSVTPEPVPTSASPAVFKEIIAETPASSAAAAPLPTTTTIQIQEPAPVTPTTFAQVVSSAAPVVSSAAPVVSSAAPVVSSTPPTAATGGKRGIAYNDASFLPAFSGAPSVSWCYNWGGNTPQVPSNLEFIPTLWGLGSHANNWEKYADSAIASGSKHLFSFNEPDHGEQASTDPGTAAAGYMQYMQPYAGKAKLIAPSVTNGGGQMGLTWLSNFLNACSSCTIDAINVHWYNGGDAAAFKTHMESAHKIGGNRPVWITEFEAPGSVAEQVAFLADVLPWLDSQPWIERYSLFMAREGLMMANGGLSEIGKAFIA